VSALRHERLLARAFFSRLFESELMPPGFPQVQLVIWSIAMLAAPGFMMAFRFERHYARLSITFPGRIPDAILDDELLFVTYSMLALGLVALVAWEGVFPDRRDVRTLGVLPLPTRTHVIGRLGALAALAGLFSLGANVVSAVVYGTVLWAYGAAVSLPRGVGAVFVATALAGLCVFFTLITAQGLLLAVFGRRAAERLALALQGVFVVVLLQAFMFVPYLGSVMRAGFHAREQTRASFLAPGWFVALLDVLAGTPAPVPAGFGVAAVSATLAAIILATALLAGSYRRLERMALETPDGRASGRSGFVWRLSARWAQRLAAHPVQSAVTGFTLRTLTRSRTHLILLAMYVGIGVALVLSTLIPVIVARGSAVLWTPNAAMLSAPLILNFFILCGQRVLLAVPTDIRANWVLRLYAPDEQIYEAIRGVRIALLLTAVAPIALAAGVAGLALWGVRIAALHAIFTAAAGLLLVDLLLIGLRKIPFTCTYHPGRSRARTLWPLYIGAFSMYAFGLARLEAIAMDAPLVFVATLLVIAGVDRALARLRRYDLQAPPGLTYAEEDPDALFMGFRLSEGLAAESRPRPVVPHIE
jgi:hypothetical protein